MHDMNVSRRTPIWVSALVVVVSIVAVASVALLAVSMVPGLAGVSGIAGGPSASDKTRATFSTDVVHRLDALVAAFPGRAGLWIADRASTAPLYAHDANTNVTTASLYKLGVLMEAERRVDSGQLRYRDMITIGEDDVTAEGSGYEVGAVLSVDDALEAMITQSDNGAALALWHLFGGDTIDATLARAGMRDFHVTFDAAGNTVATPRAIGTFFGLLARKELVSAAASERMLARLQRQTINDRLPAALPKQTVVAHKTGNLEGLIHDAGIIFTPKGERIVVVMTSDAYEGANAFIAEIALIVYVASLEAAGEVHIP
jgi:beta-lactamase class A